MTDRIRGRRLQRIRANHFRRHPLCVECERRGIVRLATALDHKTALVNGGKDVESNRQGLCADCHELKTRADLGQRQSNACDAAGQPKGSSHHWNQG